MTRTLCIALAALGVASCDGDGNTNKAGYTVGGSVTGLRGSGLVLLNNGVDPLTINSDGAFEFAAALERFAPYSVTVQTQPTATPPEVCSVVNGEGSNRRGPITDVMVRCRGLTGRYLYTLSGGTEPKASGFLIDPIAGTLSEIAGSPFPIQTASGGPGALLTTGRFLFMTGQYIEVRKWLTGYAVDLATGALTLIPDTPVHLPLSLGRPFFDPQGRALYMVVAGQLHAYAIDPTSGALTPTQTPASPHHVGASSIFSGGFPPPPFNSDFDAFTEDGTTAFLVYGSEVRSFAVDATSGALTYLGRSYAVDHSGTSGVLTVHPGGKFGFLRSTDRLRVVRLDDPTSMPIVLGPGIAQDLSTPVGAIVDETGQYVYVVGDERAAQQASGRFLLGFRFDAGTGDLTPLVGSPYRMNYTDVTPRLAMDPLRRFIVAYHETFGVAVFKIDASTGEVVQVPGSPFTPSVGVAPEEIVFDPSGNFAYMTDIPSSSVSAYSFDSTNGRFAFVGSYPVAARPINGAAIVGLH